MSPSETHMGMSVPVRGWVLPGPAPTTIPSVGTSWACKKKNEKLPLVRDERCHMNHLGFEIESFVWFSFKEEAFDYQSHGGLECYDGRTWQEQPRSSPI